MSFPKGILGRNIYELRNWYGWSRSRLAREAHVPELLVRQIEYGGGDPKLSQLRDLANAFKVMIGDLLKPGTEILRIDSVTRERLMKKVFQLGPDNCWKWLGAKHERYGLYQYDGQRGLPHRYIYAIDRPLMKNWDLDHKCNNPLCVNPNHLEVVTRGTNLNRRDRRRENLKRREKRKSLSLTELRAESLTI